MFYLLRFHQTFWEQTNKFWFSICCHNQTNRLGPNDIAIMIETNAIWFESCALKEIRRMDGSTASSAVLHSPSSHLTREQMALLNFDEVVALCYFAITLYYGFLRYQNSRFAIAQHFNRHSRSTDTHYEFFLIHWFIIFVAVMGLANFLLSLSILEVMDHNTSIGSKVLKFSYVSKFWW